MTIDAVRAPHTAELELQVYQVHSLNHEEPWRAAYQVLSAACRLGNTARLHLAPNTTRHVCACRWMQRRPDGPSAVCARYRLADGGQAQTPTRPIYMPPLVRRTLRNHSHSGRVVLHESGASPVIAGSRTKGCPAGSTEELFRTSLPWSPKRTGRLHYKFGCKARPCCRAQVHSIGELHNASLS